MHKLKKFNICFAIATLFAAPFAVHAQVVIPGPADVGRVSTDKKEPVLEKENNSISLPKAEPITPAPEEAKSVNFVLQQVDIEGATVFTPEELSELYQPYLGKVVSMDIIWEIAGKITDKYRAEGYFLSRAYVPEQHIKKGKSKIQINVVEGYIGDVELKDPSADSFVVKRLIADILAKKPVKAQEIENLLLKLNDLPGVAYRAVLSPADEKAENENAVKLTLVAQKQKGHGSVNFDNYGSRFLGPNESYITYQGSIIPMQQTTLTALSSMPSDELKYGTIDHIIPITSEVSFDINGGITRAIPGYNLAQFDIDSKSSSIGGGFNYAVIRQRDENLTLKINFDGKNTSNTIMNTPFNRDHVRAVRATADFDLFDKWNGYDSADFKFSQGIDGLGASDKGDLRLSRIEALPDFTKAELAVSRLQRISDDFNILGSFSGQKASGPLFSSEEFGYGGQSFGRAYDSSEITGDDGVSASLELRYVGIADKWHSFAPTPYIFYDAGKVWNYDSSQVSTASGSSAGFGIRFASIYDITGNAGLAFPLTREISTPVYGQGRKDPRILLQFSKGF